MSVQKLYGPWNNSFFKEKTNLFLDSVLVLGPNNVYNFYKFSLHEREIVLYLKRNSFLYVWTWNQKFFNTHMNENNCVQQTKLCYNAENNPLNMTTNHNYWCYKSMKTMICQCAWSYYLYKFPFNEREFSFICMDMDKEISFYG